ncbi:DUF6292 family protein [Amycolatopsis sp. NPDC051903]|uniref:DUF6292 family protein n=1 Tax=Amycolatopsis sp. NPDC051903 TaxID=3363936 RepID=UPI00378DE892
MKPDRGHVSPLREYVESIACLLRVEPEASWCEEGRPSTAYIALAEQVPCHPGRLLMAQWSSDSGWSLALEPECGEAPVVLSAWPHPARPAPTVVARRFRAALNDLAHRRRPPRSAPRVSQRSLSTSVSNTSEPPSSSRWSHGRSGGAL